MLAAILPLILLLPSYAQAEAGWVRYMKGALPIILNKAPGEYGIYIKSLKDSSEFGHNENKTLYYASTIKMFVLLEVMFAEYSGKLDLSSLHTISEVDLRDGSALSKKLKAGDKIRLHELVENMIMHSDNLATDILIGKVGLSEINQRIQSLSNEQIGPITTLLRVRQEMYGNMNEKGKDLSNLDYFNIGKVFNTKYRLNTFAKLVGKKPGTYTTTSWYKATEKYYQAGMNSGSVKAYAGILEKLATPSEIPRPVADNVFKYLYKTQTGKSRIRKSLPKNIDWAHKTGTQTRRVCDMGVAGPNKGKDVIITICAKDFGPTSAAEKQLARISLALSRSKIFTDGNSGPP